MSEREWRDVRIQTSEFRALKVGALLTSFIVQDSVEVLADSVEVLAQPRVVLDIVSGLRRDNENNLPSKRLRCIAPFAKSR